MASSYNLLGRLSGSRIKPLTAADLGGGSGNQTHIGLLQDSFEGWDVPIRCVGHVFRGRTHRSGIALVDPILNADGTPRSPKLRKGNTDELDGADSVLSIIRDISVPGDGLAIVYSGGEMAFLIIPSAEIDSTSPPEVLPRHLDSARRPPFAESSVQGDAGPTGLIDDGLSDFVVSALEGEPREVTVRWLYRSRELRDAYVNANGWDCKACGVSLSSVYGPVAAGLVDVHHTKPLAGLDGTPTISSISDLVGLCPNCHRVSHRRVPPYAVEEIRMFLGKSGYIFPDSSAQ